MTYARDNLEEGKGGTNLEQTEQHQIETTATIQKNVPYNPPALDPKKAHLFFPPPVFNRRTGTTESEIDVVRNQANTKNG